MWKPGTTKPSAKSSNSSKRKSLPSSLMKSPPPSENGTRETTSHSDDVHDKKKTKTLSGATLNMRFMQRKLQPGSRKSEGRSTKSTDRELRPSAASHASPTEQHASQQQQQPQISLDTRASKQGRVSFAPDSTSEKKKHHQLQPDDDMMDVDSDDDDNQTSQEASAITTSACDMYGLTGSIILGRRSFGGFNPHVASAWRTSQRSSLGDGRFDDNSNISSRHGDSKQQQHRMSDSEILKQYQKSRNSINRTNNNRKKSPMSEPKKKKQRLSG